MSDKEDLERALETVTEQERDYALNALAEFNKANYGPCLQHLNKLDNRTYDFKVAMNKIVVDYYKSDLKKTEAFRKNLNAFYNQFRMRIDKLDDVNHSVAHFNQAVLLFHQRQYTQGIRIMERVYKFIEPMDETLGRQVVLLLIELHISVRQLDKAVGLIAYLENQLMGGNTIVPKLGDKILKQSEKHHEENKKPVVLDAAGEEFKRKLAKYRARCYIMTHSISLAMTEVQNLLTFDKNNVAAQYLKANLEYLQGNYQESMSILNKISNDCLAYNETGESGLLMQNNNLGVVHHAMGKPNLACHYYQQALKEDILFSQNTTQDNGDKPLYTIGGSKYHELMYNLGISMLHAGHTLQTFDCLIIAVRRYHRNSRLWLRLAECCIQIHKQSNEIDFDVQKKQKEMVVEVLGTKKNQKVVLTKNLSKDKKYSVEGQSYAVPVPTLEFASLCLKNAYLLLPSNTVSSPIPLLLIPGVTPPAPPPSPGPAPSTPLSPDAIASLRNAILAASGYVSLCLGDYILTLEHARNLLSQPSISGAHKLLAHLYAAEGLVLLDKIPDALEHLNPENVKDISLELPREDISLKDKEMVKACPPSKWFPLNLESAQSVLQYNIAVCKTMRGQLDQAASLLKQIWQGRGTNCQVPAHIIMLVLYIELQLGHADIARSLIKQYSLQYRISG